MKLVAKFKFDDYFCEVLYFDHKYNELYIKDRKYGKSLMTLNDVVEIKILNEEENTRPKEGDIKL